MPGIILSDEYDSGKSRGDLGGVRARRGSVAERAIAAGVEVNLLPDFVEDLAGRLFRWPNNSLTLAIMLARSASVFRILPPGVQLAVPLAAREYGR